MIILFFIIIFKQAVIFTFFKKNCMITQFQVKFRKKIIIFI